MLKFVFTTIVGAVTAVSAHALDFDRYELENGLEVIVVPDHRAPVVVNFVWYRTGAADEVAGKTGIAHVLEHLMFKGTKDIPPGEFSKIIARNGGKDNAFTSLDYTAYYQKIAKDRLEVAMRMEADRMGNLELAEKDFQTERDVVLEERRWRVESKPVSRFYEALQSTFFTSHPYGRPVIGWKKDLEGLTRQDALDWYNQGYAPNNATLILVGDITLEEAKPLVAKTYGKVAKRDVLRPAWLQEPVFKSPKVYRKIDKEVKVPNYIKMYRAPSRFLGVAGSKEGTEDALALSLASDILGGGKTSRLYKTLVQEMKIANAVFMGYTAVMRNESSVDISAQPKPDIKLSQLETAIQKVVDNFIKNGVDDKELQRAKSKMLSLDVYARDDPFVSAYHLGKWIVSGGRAQDFDNWIEEVKLITVDDVQRAAAKYLTGHNTIVGLLAADEADF